MKKWALRRYTLYIQDDLILATWGQCNSNTTLMFYHLMHLMMVPPQVDNTRQHKLYFEVIFLHCCCQSTAVFSLINSLRFVCSTNRQKKVSYLRVCGKITHIKGCKR